MSRSLAHCVCYADRALTLSILDAETDHMSSHAANLTEAARAVVRAARQCTTEQNEDRSHLAALLMAAEFLGSMSLACSEEAERVVNSGACCD